MLSHEQIIALLSDVTPATLSKRLKEQNVSPGDLRAILDVLADKQEHANKLVIDKNVELTGHMMRMADFHNSTPKNKTNNRSSCPDCHGLMTEYTNTKSHRKNDHKNKCYGSCRGGSTCLRPACTNLCFFYVLMLALLSRCVVAHASSRTPSEITTNIAMTKQELQQLKQQLKHYNDLLVALQKYESNTNTTDQKNNLMARIACFKYSIL